MTNKGDILLVDDTPASLELVSRVLKDEGFSVRVADSGERALAAAAAEPPELILLDVRMPGLDGFEVFRRLKAMPATSEVPVIFLTAALDPADFVDGLKLGAVDYISKPFVREALLAKARTHTELFRLRKKLEQQAQELSVERDRLKLSANLAREKNAAFSELLVNPELKAGNVETVKRLLTEAAARLAGVARASIWEYSADGLELRCLDLYESGPGKHSEGLVLKCADYPRYFKALREKASIAAADARTHPGTSEFTAGYLVPLGITSMLDGLIPGSGGLSGVFCLEHIGEIRRWSPEEENLLSTLSTLTAIVFDIDRQKRIEKELRENEERFALLFEQAPLGYQSLDENGNFLAVNRAWLETLGYTGEEVLGKWFGDFTAPEFTDAFRERFALLKAEGKICSEFHMLHKNGEKRFVAFEGRVGYRPDGSFKQTHCILQDITEKKKAERQLAEQAAAIRAIIESNKFPVFSVDRQYRYLHFNQAHAAVMKILYGAEIKAGGALSEYQTVQEDLQRAKKNLDRALSGESFIESAFSGPEGGERRYLEVAHNPMRTESGEIIGASVFALDITERVRAESDRDRLAKAIEQAGEVVMITDPEGLIQYVNPAFEKVTGYSRRDVIGGNPRLLKSGLQDEAFYKDLWGKISSGETWEGRMVNRRKDGTLYTEEATISPVRDQRGRTVNYVAVKRDITEQLKLEGRIRQSQKMETIGMLAGGVAHDFNNILSAIMCSADFLAKSIAPADPAQKDVKEITAASERAAALTRQLLAFSRRQIMATRVVDINGLAGRMTSLLGRIIGEGVNLAVKLNPSPCTVSVDPGQIEQVIMNLVLNARDAMPGGGTVTLETEIINPPKDFFDAHPDLAAGPLVCFRVRDTGCGMSEEVKAHLFEPFFTTKEQGKGTGLGLSTAFGIIKQSRGEIAVESEPGKGSVFTLYLPLTEAGAQDKTDEKVEGNAAKGHETVLFVEDEESLRRLGARILTENGYTVLVGADGEAALKLMEERGKPVDLLISDVVMPGMSGRELGLELARRKLVDRALYMSGYTDEAIVKHGVLEPGIAFIYKPYTVEGLLKKLREALDGPAGQAKI